MKDGSNFKFLFLFSLWEKLKFYVFLVNTKITYKTQKFRVNSRKFRLNREIFAIIREL